LVGADATITPMLEKLNKGISRWDVRKYPHENLQLLLEMEFPVKGKATAEDISVECGICYSYKLDNAIPDRVCDNPKCGRPYHRNCLYEWLRSIPSSLVRQSFNTIFGVCPYCSYHITCKMT